MKVAETAHFLTLTYDEEQIPWTNTKPTLHKPDFQLFMKRLRSRQKRKKSQWKIRYYAVGEYGSETKRPHYHAITFNLHPKILSELTDIWDKGFVDIGTVTPASIRYVTKYVINKVGQFTDQEKPFALMSRNPGLGANYLDTTSSFHKSNKKETVRNDVGLEQPMPRYYKEKIFTDYQRAKMTKINQEKAISREIENARQYAKEGKNYQRLKDQGQQEDIKNINRRLNSKNKL